jgi:pimeloyl-ACP methyl ester carboxylesterase
MERRSFETPLGDVWLWGDAEAFDGEAPLVFVIHGAFAAMKPRLKDLELVLPVSVLSSWLPGQGSPDLSEVSVEAFGSAYSAAFGQLAGSRRSVVCGESVGALVALASSAENVIALDPPLRTEKLWPLFPLFRDQLAADPSCAEFLWNILGVSADEVTPRDYRSLLNRKARVIVGASPLYPERELLNGFPSMVDEPEREEMRRSSCIRLTVAQGAGHVIPGNAPDLFVSAVRDALGGNITHNDDHHSASKRVLGC